MASPKRGEKRHIEEEPDADAAAAAAAPPSPLARYSDEINHLKAQLNASIMEGLKPLMTEFKDAAASIMRDDVHSRVSRELVELRSHSKKADERITVLEGQVAFLLSRLEASNKKRR